jgi:hypothetical protein
MDLQPMTMERNEARKAFLEYRDAFRRDAQALDGELMRGYRALAEGSALIRLTTTIAAGGVDDLGRPRLAIARADERAITFWRDSRGTLQFETDSRSRAADRRKTFPVGTLPAWTGPIPQWHGWLADVPPIPPRYRPSIRLSNYHILWEAVWRQARTRAALDPALLRHIGGDLYVVLATWDLTPLEQAVLEGRG